MSKKEDPGKDTLNDNPVKDMNIIEFSNLLRLLRTLRNDSRARFISISKDANIPVVEIYDLYYLLRKAALVKNSSLLDFKKLQFDIRAFIVLEFTPKSLFLHDSNNERMIHFLNSCINVNSLSLTDTGLIADVVFDSEKKYEAFIASLKGFEMKGLQEYFIDEEVVREKFLS